MERTWTISYRHKGYTCIKNFLLVNEPNFEGGGWEVWKKGVQNVAQVLVRRKLNVTFVGTDAVFDEGWHHKAVNELASIFGVWDMHRYASQEEVRKGGLEPILRGYWDYVRTNDLNGKNKSCIIGEAGMSDGAQGAGFNPNVETYNYGVFMADFAVQATRAGTAGVSAWMLDDSTQDGFNWGMWKNKAGNFALKPWFTVWSLLSRLIPPNSTIYRVDAPSPNTRILAAQWKPSEPQKRAAPQWTFCLVNRDSAPQTLTLKVPDGSAVRLKRYAYSHEYGSQSDKDGFPLPTEEMTANLKNGVEIICPANSVVFLTSVER